MKYVPDTNVCIRLLRGVFKPLKNRIRDIPNSDIIVASIVRFEFDRRVHLRPAERYRDTCPGVMFRDAYIHITISDLPEEKCYEFGNVISFLREAAVPVSTRIGKSKRARHLW